jgi:hypothetical protein
MGTSTVSGPFRSQNGFQELVDGVWTPVGGGGSGGGNAPIVIDRSTSDSIVIPAVPTAVGQVYTYFFPMPNSGSGTAIDVKPPLVDGTTSVVVSGRTILYGFSGPPTTVEAYGPDASSANTIRVNQPGISGFSDDFTAFFQFVYMGIKDGYAQYQVLNSTYITNTFGSRIVTL